MNRFGLPRAIPEAIKRAVRQRDGFGCVVCGFAIIEYEHFDPEFRDAQEHTTDGILLLCVSCHARKTRGLLSRKTIENSRHDPKAKQAGFSFAAFDVGNQAPKVVLGTLEATNVPIILSVYGESNFRVDPPEMPGGPFRISARVYDRYARPILDIVENEWQTRITNWDVNLVGQTLTIRSGLRDIDLVMRTDPPDTLIFERLRMSHRGVTIESRPLSATRIILPDDNVIETTGMILNGCQKAIEVTETGFALGVGGGSVSIREMTLSPETPRQVDNMIPFHRR